MPILINQACAYTAILLHIFLPPLLGLGELAKNQGHQDAVVEAGCCFIPVVVETFGV